MEQTLIRGRRVLLVEDNLLLAEAFRSFLQGRSVEVIGPAVTALEAAEVFRAECPDVVLVDVGLPDGNGIDLGRQFLEERPDTIVIALTACRDRPTLEEALRSGFRGFLTKDSPVSTVVESIVAAVEGQVVVSMGVAPLAGPARSPDEEHAALVARQLTNREREVLSLVAQGMSTKEMGKHLGVSNHTARTHVENVFAKLQVHSRLEATAFALRYRLVDLDEAVYSRFG